MAAKLLANITNRDQQSKLAYPNFMSDYNKKGKSNYYDQYFASIIIVTVLLCIICFVGTVGNCLVIHVFRRHLNKSSSTGGRSTSNFYILLLAVIDLIICLVDIPTTLYWTVWQNDSFDLLCKMQVTLKAFFIAASSLLLVLIAIDRFLLICFVPGIQMSRRAIVVALLGILALGLSIGLPMGLHTGVNHSYQLKTMDIISKLGPADNSSALKSSYQNFLALFGPKQTTNNSISSQNWNEGLAGGDRRPGPCQSDPRIITNEQYQYYLIVVTILYIILFVIITLFYTIIFTFVWWRQNAWQKRYNSTTLSLSSKLPNATTVTNPAPNNNNNNNKQNRPLLQTGDGGRVEPDANSSIELQPLTDTSEAEAKVKLPSTNTAKDQDQQQHQGRNRRKPHIRTAQTLAVITVTFVVSYIPYFLIVNRLLWPVSSTSPESVIRNNVAYYQQLKRVIFYLYYCNSAANPIIYSCMNVTFRNEMFSLLQTLRGFFTRK